MKEVVEEELDERLLNTNHNSSCTLSVSISVHHPQKCHDAWSYEAVLRYVFAQTDCGITEAILCFGREDIV